VIVTRDDGCVKPSNPALLVVEAVA